MCEEMGSGMTRHQVAASLEFQLTFLWGEKDSKPLLRPVDVGLVHAACIRVALNRWDFNDLLPD